MPGSGLIQFWPGLMMTEFPLQLGVSGVFAFLSLRSRYPGYPDLHSVFATVGAEFSGMDSFSALTVPSETDGRHEESIMKLQDTSNANVKILRKRQRIVMSSQ